MDAVPGTDALLQELERRERIQKLRWLGLHDEADQLAHVKANPNGRIAGVPLPVAHPETD